MLDVWQAGKKAQQRGSKAQSGRSTIVRSAFVAFFLGLVALSCACGLVANMHAIPGSNTSGSSSSAVGMGMYSSSVDTTSAPGFCATAAMKFTQATRPSAPGVCWAPLAAPAPAPGLTNSSTARNTMPNRVAAEVNWDHTVEPAESAMCLGNATRPAAAAAAAAGGAARQCPASAPLFSQCLHSTPTAVDVSCGMGDSQRSLLWHMDQHIKQQDVQQQQQQKQQQQQEAPQQEAPQQEAPQQEVPQQVLGEVNASQAHCSSSSRPGCDMVSLAKDVFLESVIHVSGGLREGGLWGLVGWD
jgi:hypothetical protein